VCDSSCEVKQLHKLYQLYCILYFVNYWFADGVSLGFNYQSKTSNVKLPWLRHCLSDNGVPGQRRLRALQQKVLLRIVQCCVGWRQFCRQLDLTGSWNGNWNWQDLVLQKVEIAMRCNLRPPDVAPVVLCCLQTNIYCAYVKTAIFDLRVKIPSPLDAATPIS